jgi:sn-glycerol 3-phosphate transport system permease protein
MEKKVVFQSAWLPYALLAPQIAVTVVFFFWPAAQAVYYSFLQQDPFGLSTEFVWLRNYAELFQSSHYLESFKVTAVFSLSVATLGIAISLLLATMADRIVRGALGYKTFLIWPYAVAPAVAGVLWAFLFAPSIGIITYVLKRMGVDWNWIIDGEQAMLLVVIAATWKQISYNFLFPLLSPTTFFLLVINIVYAFFDTFGVIDATTQGGPGGATQILVYKVYYDGVKAADLGSSAAQSVILMFIVISLTVIQFKFVEKKVQY